MKEGLDHRTLAVLPEAVLTALTDELNVEPLRLLHPRTALPCLFLAYPCDTRLEPNDRRRETKLVEIQAVCPPNSRSWFLDNTVIGDGKLIIMTPIDPALLLLPILQILDESASSMRKFRPADELLEEALQEHEKHAQNTPNVESSPSQWSKDCQRFYNLDCTQAALRRVCEMKEITAEIVVYRYSLEKVVKYLRSKVARLVSGEHLEHSKTITRALAREGLLEDDWENLLQAGRLKAACDLISHHIPKQVYDALILSYDFTNLIAHQKRMEEEAAAQLAAAALSVPAGKRSKSQEKPTVAGKKRKAPKASTGVEKLKKVNVTGMAKMTSFFKPKA